MVNDRQHCQVRNQEPRNRDVLHEQGPDRAERIVNPGLRSAAGRLTGSAAASGLFAMRTNPQIATSTKHEVRVYERASWPNWTSNGDKAISRPVPRPVRGPRISAASPETSNTNTAPNTAAGNRSIHPSISAEANGPRSRK